MVCPYMVIWGSSGLFHVSFATRIWSFRFGALSVPQTKYSLHCDGFHQVGDRSIIALPVSGFFLT